ncbi:hypothetical protein ACHAXT_009212 [Thalassiosira profunda]
MALNRQKTISCHHFPPRCHAVYHTNTTSLTLPRDDHFSAMKIAATVAAASFVLEAESRRRGDGKRVALVAEAASIRSGNVRSQIRSTNKEEDVDAGILDAAAALADEESVDVGIVLDALEEDDSISISALEEGSSISISLSMASAYNTEFFMLGSKTGKSGAKTGKSGSIATGAKSGKSGSIATGKAGKSGESSGKSGKSGGGSPTASPIQEEEDGEDEEDAEEEACPALRSECPFLHDYQACAGVSSFPGNCDTCRTICYEDSGSSTGFSCQEDPLCSKYTECSVTGASLGTPCNDGFGNGDDTLCSGVAVGFPANCYQPEGCRLSCYYYSDGGYYCGINGYCQDCAPDGVVEGECGGCGGGDLFIQEIADGAVAGALMMGKAVSGTKANPKPYRKWIRGERPEKNLARTRLVV